MQSPLSSTVVVNTGRQEGKGNEWVVGLTDVICTECAILANILTFVLSSQSQHLVNCSSNSTEELQALGNQCHTVHRWKEAGKKSCFCFLVDQLVAHPFVGPVHCIHCIQQFSLNKILQQMQQSCSKTYHMRTVHVHTCAVKSRLGVLFQPSVGFILKLCALFAK